MREQPKHHYYLFSFMRWPTVASQRIGWSTEGVNEPRINEAKAALGLPSDAVPMSVSYLGHMTPAEMRGDDPL